MSLEGYFKGPVRPDSVVRFAVFRLQKKVGFVITTSTFSPSLASARSIILYPRSGLFWTKMPEHVALRYFGMLSQELARSRESMLTTSHSTTGSQDHLRLGVGTSLHLHHLFDCPALALSGCVQHA